MVDMKIVPTQTQIPTPQKNQAIDTSEDSAPNVKDAFEKNSVKNRLAHKAVSLHLKRISKKREVESPRILRSGPLSMSSEEKFLRNPTVRQYYRLVKDFDQVFLDSNQDKFQDMEKFLVALGSSNKNQDFLDSKLAQEEKKLEKWHKKHDKEFGKLAFEAEHRIEKRNKKIIEDGVGFGGRMTNYVGGTKAASFFAKNRLTIRGNMFKINNELCGKSIYEMLPRYGSRKGQHMGVRITQFGINAIITAIGYSLAPVSFGISAIVSTHAQTVVTLSGEVIALKLDGAKKEKIVSHASLRGVQLEIPKAIPIVGSIINYGENAMMGSAAFGIVSTTIADWIMKSVSGRYTSTLNIDDLGDPRVLSQINDRIDYLSRFLLPIGQYLLLKETRSEHQANLRKILKVHFKTLVSLEHKKTKALNFYRLSLLSEIIPFDYREEIKRACDEAMSEKKINNHRVVRQCLASLKNSTAA